MLRVWFWIIRRLQVYCVCQGLENLMIAIAGMQKELSGRFLDACMVESDGIVIVGTFSSFDGQSVKNIVKLNAEGTLDETL